MIKTPRITVFPMLAAVLLIVGACNQPKTGGELQSGILLKNMDTTAIPGNDFTRYVNGSWVKNTKIPADKSSYGVGSMVNDKAQEDVKAIIENAAKGSPKADSEEQKIGDFYESYMNMKVRGSIGLNPLKEEFEKIDGIRF